MKYWIGFLAAAILGAITWALTQLGARFTVLVDMVYPYVTRTLQDVLANWSSSVDFCLWQFAVIALGVLAAAVLILVIILRRNVLPWLGWTLALCSGIYMLHMLVFGLNYYAGPLADDLRLEMQEYSIKELTEATSYYRDKANELATQIPRDAEGNPDFDEFDTLALLAEGGVDARVYDYSFPVFAGCTLPVKQLGWADMYSSMGITGVTMGLTGEAAVNPQIPDVTLPFTMCHEMAHRMSIATERDANFAAFLACQANEDLQYQYSAYFMAYRYCDNALLSAGTAEASAAAARVVSEASDLLKQDMQHYSTFFASKRSETATKVADTANDTYLKASGDKAGIASYGEVCDLLVSWHIQEIVLPSLTEEADPFDPMDETQVDLSGIVNAEPVPTEGGVG